MWGEGGLPTKSQKLGMYEARGRAAAVCRRFWAQALGQPLQKKKCLKSTVPALSSTGPVFDGVW